MSESHPTIKAAVHDAKAHKGEVEFTSDKVLLVDWDRPHIGGFISRLNFFSPRLGITQIMKRKSKSGNWHIKMELGKDYSIEERLFFQSLLGSDPIREFLSWVRSQDPRIKEPNAKQYCSMLFLADGEWEEMKLPQPYVPTTPTTESEEAK